MDTVLLFVEMEQRRVGGHRSSRDLSIATYPWYYYLIFLDSSVQSAISTGLFTRSTSVVYAGGPAGASPRLLQLFSDIIVKNG